MKSIIDADIIRSSGTSEAPVSSSSRHLLDIIANSDKHYVVCCQTLLDEWKKHKSKYSSKWMVLMFSRKKLLILDNVPTETKLFIESLEENAITKIALKDAHLVDLAIHNDKLIFSNDLRAKKAFASILDNRDNFNNILWLSPNHNLDIINDTLLRGHKIFDQNLMMKPIESSE